MGNKQTQVLPGVIVIWDDTKHAKVNAKDGPRDKTSIPYSAADEFTPGRIVVDLKLNLGDDTVKMVTLNDVHVQIAYSATGSDKPIAGWWDGQKWVKFKQMTFADNLIDVTLPPSWPIDPPIAVFP